MKDSINVVITVVIPLVTAATVIDASAKRKRWRDCSSLASNINNSLRHDPKLPLSG